MALTFTPIVAGTTGKIVKEESFTDEFKAEFGEAWDYLKDGSKPGLSTTFPDAKTRDKWFNLAVAYGRREGVVVTRVKGTDSMNKEHGRLSFKMESEAVRDQRVADAAARAERNMILRSYGHEVGAGIKTDEQIAAEDATLTKHYAKTPADQEKHLKAWMAGAAHVPAATPAPAAPVAPEGEKTAPKPGPKPGIPGGHGHSHGEK